MTTTTDKVSKIRNQNDKLRRGHGKGQVLVTRTVRNLAIPTHFELYQKVIEFDDFNQDNDPHGEHDFAIIKHEGERYFFKIDYYDNNYQFRSPDPSDEIVTKRIMTIGHMSDY